MARQDEQQAMEGLLRRSFARKSDAGACPDAGILAAYFERSLAADEILQYELHFSQCARCRGQLAAIARISEAVGAGDAAGEKSAHRAWLFGWHWLAPAALAMSLVLVWFIRYRVQTRTNAHPWTAPMVSMMKDQPNSSATAGQPPAPSGDLAYAPPSSRQANAPARLKSPIVMPEKVAPKLEGGDAERIDELAKKELDRSADRTASAGALSAGEYSQARVEHAVAEPTNEPKAKPAAAPLPSLAMNSGPKRLTMPAFAPPPASSAPPKPSEPAQQAPNVSDGKAVASNAQPHSSAAPGGTANGATGAAIVPPPVAPMATQSVAVTQTAASASVAATDQNSSTTSSLTQTVIGGEARVADSGSANSRAAIAKANESQKTAETKSRQALAAPNQAAKENAKSSTDVAQYQSIPSATEEVMVIAGPVTIATPNRAVSWQITPEGVVQRSTDSGATWQVIQVSPSGRFVAGSAPERNVCWLVGGDGLIFVTSDARRWKRLEPPVRMDIASVEAKDASSATITLADGTRYETSDGGKKWHVVQ
jgi:hypothetical protein